jgi:hypothetical protein
MREYTNVKKKSKENRDKTAYYNPSTITARPRHAIAAKSAARSAIARMDRR